MTHLDQDGPLTAIGAAETRPEWVGELPACHPVPSDPDEDRIRALAERFIRWPLPASVCSDGCCSIPSYKHRTGTNLLTYDEACQMLRHVLGEKP